MTTTDELLRSHRLVSARWRVIRGLDEPTWHARPAVHDECGEACPCSRFHRVADALLWVDTQTEGAQR